MAINLTASIVDDNDFPIQLEAALDAVHVFPAGIVLELTESVVMAKPDLTQHILERLRGMGFQLAIDDFGTGYSSLAYLGSLPVDEIKTEHLAWWLENWAAPTQLAAEDGYSEGLSPQFR